MKHLDTGKVTVKGQVTIPAELREIWGLKEGDRVRFVVDERGNVNAEPLKRKSIFDVVGILKSDTPFSNVAEHRDNVRKEMISRDVERQNQEV